MWKVKRAQSLTIGSREVYAGARRAMRDRPDFSLPAGISPRETPSSPRGNRGRRGRGAAVLLLALAALAAGAFVLLRVAGTGAEGAGEQSSEALRPQGGARASDTTPPAGAAPVSRAGARTADPQRSPESPTRRLPSFSGRGSVRGLVSVVGGGPLPVAFSVHVGPSASLQGRERAQPRSVEVAGSAEFTIADLPLGGYDVWVVAPDMNTVRTPVLLSEASSDPYVMLRISPTGYLDGFAVCADGRPARELRVALESHFGAERLETTTRADGFYRFDSVPDGEYRILFGPLHAPLLSARELVFQAPSMRFPRTELPPTSDVLFHTTDGVGRALSGVTLTGFGKPSGRVEVTSDADGLAWVYNLPPGRYRLAARNAEGLRRSVTVQVEIGPGQEHWIALR